MKSSTPLLDAFLAKSPVKKSAGDSFDLGVYASVAGDRAIKDGTPESHLNAARAHQKAAVSLSGEDHPFRRREAHLHAANAAWHREEARHCSPNEL